MKITSPILFLLIGSLLTISLTFIIPLICDPLIAMIIPLKSIGRGQFLAHSLAAVQSQDNIILDKQKDDEQSAWLEAGRVISEATKKITILNSELELKKTNHQVINREVLKAELEKIKVLLIEVNAQLAQVVVEDEVLNSPPVLQYTEQLVPIIPAYSSFSGNAKASFLIKITWLIFAFFFLLPVAIMLPLHWYERRKLRMTPRIIPGSPKVSLILPAYNEEKFIKKSIEQALKQDYKGEMEIIVIDDGSTDKTLAIAQQCALNYPNVKVYQHQKNSGKPAALNTGFHKATGSISVFSDTDSHLDEDLVSRMVPHFDDPKVGMVAGMIIIDNEINILTKLQQIEYLYNQEIVRFCQHTHKGVLICPGELKLPEKYQVLKELLLKMLTLPLRWPRPAGR